MHRRRKASTSSPGRSTWGTRTVSERNSKMRKPPRPSRASRSSRCRSSRRSSTPRQRRPDEPYPSPFNPPRKSKGQFHVLWIWPFLQSESVITKLNQPLVQLLYLLQLQKNSLVQNQIKELKFCQKLF